jgi:hypothetical protein
MARSRNIKPGFFTNDVLGELPALTRLLFAGIWTICDREGRLEDRPKKIRAEVLPYDLCDADEMLQQLHDNGFIQRYTVGGKAVIQVLAWAEHQNPHMKEAASSLPAPDKHQTSTVLAAVEEQPLPERAGLIPSSLIPDSLISDSKEEKIPRKREPALQCPDDVDEQVWKDWVQLRKSKRATVSLTAVDGARDEAGKAGMSLEAFLRIWCRRGSQGLEAEWLKPHERGSPQATGETAYQRSMRERAEQITPRIAAKAPGAFTNVIEMEVPDVIAGCLGGPRV